MCIYMCPDISFDTNGCTGIYAYMCAELCMLHICVYTSMYVFTYVYMCAYVYIRVYMCTYVHNCVCCIHGFACIYMFMRFLVPQMCEQV